jgi:hypothetical protein
MPLPPPIKAFWQAYLSTTWSLQIDQSDRSALRLCESSYSNSGELQ